MEVDMNCTAMKPVWIQSSSDLCEQQDQLLIENVGFAKEACPSPCVPSLAVTLNDASDEGKIQLYQAESKVYFPQIQCTQKPVP